MARKRFVKIHTRLGAVRLIPATAGVCEIRLIGAPMDSRKTHRATPESKVITQMLRAHGAADMNRGHGDRGANSVGGP